MKILREGILILFALILQFSSTGCAVCHYYDEINGRLLDNKDEKPIQGAAVVVEYIVEHGTVGGMQEEHFDAIETTTDSEGKFLLPEKFVLTPRLPFSWFRKQPAIYILAPEYESVRLTGEQAYSKVDQTKVLVSATAYRTIGRPIMSVVTAEQKQVYEFRVSRLETDKARADDLDTYFVSGSSSKFPHYINLFNEERLKYGLRELHGWK